MPTETMKPPFGKGLLDFFVWCITCGTRKIAHAIACAMPPHPPRGRGPTPLEQSETLVAHPNLKTWSITGPANPSYNCVAWSVGITNAWLWPQPGTVQAFDAFYKSHGWTVSSHCEREYKKRKVAIYALKGDPNDIRHASRETHDCGWHGSKLGAGLRIMHVKTELEGGKFGVIIRCYEKADENANLDLC